MRLRGGGDDSKPDVPPTADDKEAGDVRGTGSEAGDDQDASSRANIDKEALNKRVIDKETSVQKDDDREPISMTEDRKASSTTEDAKEASDVKEIGCEAEDERGAISRAGRSTKRTRQQYQKYKGDDCLTHLNEVFGDLSAREILMMMRPGHQKKSREKFIMKRPGKIFMRLAIFPPR